MTVIRAERKAGPRPRRSQLSAIFSSYVAATSHDLRRSFGASIAKVIDMPVLGHRVRAKDVLMSRLRFRHLLAATLLAGVAASITSAAAEPKPLEPQNGVESQNVAVEKSTSKPLPSFRAAVRAMLEQEVRKTGLPADIADAVVYIESNYDPSTVGDVGEIGLMQIRAGTAAILGFRGSAEELAKPEINIHYGVAYLSEAWRLADGDLCRTLMKYRAGHGEEVMTPRSVNYCHRAQNYLAALGSPVVRDGPTRPANIQTSPLANNQPQSLPVSPKDVYGEYRQGTPAASRAFWAAHEAHIRAIQLRVESKWRRMAAR